MSHEPNAPFVFVIDTADYAGNFEREMCAYITGRIGECGVGENMAELFVKETGKRPFSNVVAEPDNHGCSRPVTIYQTPRTDGVKFLHYNSVAISFATKPTKAQIALMKERALAFAALPEDDYGQKPLMPRVSKVLGFRLITQVKTIKEEVV